MKSLLNLCLVSTLVAISPLPTADARNRHNPYEPTEPPSVVVPVYVASDRAKMGDRDELDGQERGALNYSTWKVHLPHRDEWFAADNWDKNLAPLGWEKDKNATVVAPIEARGYVAEGEGANLISQELPAPTQEQFWASLINAARHSRTKQLSIYIHGYACSGDNAVYTCGVLSSALESPVLAYTWPSQGYAGLTFPFPHGIFPFPYHRDRKTITNPEITDDFDDFLKELATHVPSDVSVNIFAHSLGNKLLVTQLAQKALPPNFRFKDIVFISGDVRNREFKRAADNIVRSCKHVYIFSNPRDKALLGSRFYNFAKRVGSSFPTDLGLYVVDYSVVAQPKDFRNLAIGHYVPFEHIQPILNLGDSYDQSRYSISNDKYYVHPLLMIRRQPHEQNP